MAIRDEGRFLLEEEVRCARHDRQLRDRDPLIKRGHVVDGHEVVVAEHDERSRLDLTQLGRGEGRFLAFQLGRLLHHHPEVLLSVGRHLAI
jgi:hypothetical protein